MSNLNFSGLFGGGAFAIDPTKFNFSAYTPEPKKEVVVDPVDVVSNNTPNAQVEILEGAGTVAVTKPDPIAQAIESLKGKDLTTAFNVNPVANMTVAPVTENVDNNIRNAVQNLTAEQPVETFEPIQESVGNSNILQAVEQVQQTTQSPTDYSSMTWEDLEEQRLAGGGFSLGSDFVAQDQAAREADLTDQGLMFQAGLGEDLFQDYNPNDQFTTGAMGDVLRSGNQADFKNLIDQGTVNRLAAIGLQADYKQDEYKGYRYNPETGAYDYYDNTPSMIEQLAPDIVKTAILGVATAGAGSALASSSAVTGIAGGSTAASSAIGHGIAGSLSSAIQGGDTKDILLGGALGALGGYTEGLQTDLANAQDNLTNLSNIAQSNIAGEALIAQTQIAGAAETVQALQAHAETINMINNSVDLVQAIDEKDIIKAIDSGLALGGMESSTNLLATKLQDSYGADSFIGSNASALASTGLQAAVDIAQGEDAKDVLQNATNNILITTVATEENIRSLFGNDLEEGSFLSNNIDPLTKAITAVTHAGLEGKNREELVGEFVKTYIEEDGQILPESDGKDEDNIFKDLENWYHENIEDPLEAYWQQIEPYRDRVEAQFEAAIQLAETYVIDPAKRVVDGVIEGADTLIRSLPTEKEDWEQFEDDVKDNVVDPVVTGVRETGRFVRGLLPEGSDVEIPLPEFNIPDLPDLPDMPDMPFEFDGELTRRVSNVDYFYDESDIVRNPLLSSGNTRIQDLASTLQLEQEKAKQEARRGALKDEEGRVKRSKGVLNVGATGTVRYTG